MALCLVIINSANVGSSSKLLFSLRKCSCIIRHCERLNKLQTHAFKYLSLRRISLIRGLVNPLLARHMPQPRFILSSIIPNVILSGEEMVLYAFSVNVIHMSKRYLSTRMYSHCFHRTKHTTRLNSSHSQISYA